MGPVATVRWDDRFALRLRHLTVEVGDRISQAGPAVVSTREREGRLILGELLFEWLRHSKVRPVVGVSLGRRTFRSVTTCEPVSCAEVNASPGGPRVADGVITNRRATLGGIAGISLRAGERVTLQGLLAVHDPWQEHGETVAGMIVVSLAVWRSR